MIRRTPARNLGGLLPVGSAFAVAYVLVGGTELLMAVGLSRTTAGTITTVVVVVAIVVAMGYFATRVIDWN